MHRFALLSFTAVALASAKPQFEFPIPKGDGTFGSGPHPAYYSENADLKGHTIYAPKTLPAEKLPVILWGNGMCSDQGLGFRNFLTEIASHSYYIIANGRPEGTGQSSNEKMVNALNWIDKNAGIGALASVDKSRIGAAGQSCGGWQAYAVSTDKRIGLTGIFDSVGSTLTPNLQIA
jgi:dienelactone hydrolase